MSSLWTDLLHLHGYITDIALFRKPVERASVPTPCTTMPEPREKRPDRSWKTSLRLCLGIGDGALRSQ